MDIQNFDFNPHLFIYPTFYYYVVLTTLLLLIKLGALSFQFDPIFYSYNLITVGKIIVIGRSVTAIFGSLTVFVTYLTGRELYDNRTGLLYFSSKIMKSGDVKYYILAGISLGLGVSTKYNSGLVLVPVLTAHYLSNNRRLTLDSKIIKMGLAGFVFFVLSSPYTILAYDEFKQGLIYISYLVNFENTGFEDSGLSYIFYLKRPLLYGIGPFLLILTVIGIAHLSSSDNSNIVNYSLQCSNGPQAKNKGNSGLISNYNNRFIIYIALNRIVSSIICNE
jgi:hypothetical protein